MKKELKDFLMSADLKDQDQLFKVLEDNWKGVVYSETGNPKGAVKSPKFLLLSKPEYSTNRKLVGCLKRNRNLMYSFIINQKDKDYIVFEKY